MLLLLAGCDSGPEFRPRTEAEKAAIRDGVAAIEAQALQMDRALHEAAWAAEDNLVRTESPCPIGPDVVLGPDPSEQRQAIRLLRATVRVVGREFPGRGRYTVQASALSYDLDQKLEVTVLGDDDPLARQVRDHRFEVPDHSLLLVVERDLRPEAAGADGFDAGVLTGRAWLWSEARAKVICGAPFGAGSSDVVTASWREGSSASLQKSLTSASLNADLVKNAARSALSQLQAVESRR